jgi:hypothetical protein
MNIESIGHSLEWAILRARHNLEEACITRRICKRELKREVTRESESLLFALRRYRNLKRLRKIYESSNET